MSKSAAEREMEELNRLYFDSAVKREEVKKDTTEMLGDREQHRPGQYWFGSHNGRRS